MKFPGTSLIILFALAGWMPSALGQAPAGEAEVPTVELVVKTMAIGRGDFAGIYLQAKEKEEPVVMSFSQYRRSATVEYKGPTPLVFFRQAPNPDPTLPPLRIPVATWAIAPNSRVKEALLFFLPLAQPEADGSLFRIYAMDDSYAAFPRETLMIFNATGARLFGAVVGKEMVFEAGATGPFELNRNTRAAFAVETRDGPKMVYENVLEFAGENRVIFMLRPPKRAGSLRIEAYNIIESLDPLEEAAPGGRE